MRIRLQLSSARKAVPFNYQPQLTGTIHKWLGKNEWHDNTSLYSFSWLQGGRKTGKNLVFEHDARMDISSHNPAFIKTIIDGIQTDPMLSFGLAVTDITILETPDFSTKKIFYTSSPILVKRKGTDNDREIHYTYEDKESNTFLTETLKTKLRKAGLSDQGVTVSFWCEYSNPRTKIIYYNNIGNKVNVCPIMIEGTPEQITFAWNVGIGNSTGIGFGALK